MRRKVSQRIWFGLVGLTSHLSCHGLLVVLVNLSLSLLDHGLMSIEVHVVLLHLLLVQPVTLLMLSHDILMFSNGFLPFFHQFVEV